MGKQYLWTDQEILVVIDTIAAAVLRITGGEKMAASPITQDITQDIETFFDKQRSGVHWGVGQSSFVLFFFFTLKKNFIKV